MLKNPVKRVAYVNDQNYKRDPTTIFHSPYKSGHQNKNYINPTFLSSQVFYPTQLINQKIAAIRAVTPSKKDILRQKYMMTKTKNNQSFLKKIDNNIQQRQNKIFKNQMERQLFLLVNCKKEKGDGQNGNVEKKDLPCFLEKKTDLSPLKKKKKKDIENYIQTHQQIKKRRQDQKLTEKKKEKQIAQMVNKSFVEQISNKTRKDKELSKLLKKILQQQILQRKN